MPLPLIPAIIASCALYFGKRAIDKQEERTKELAKKISPTRDKGSANKVPAETNLLQDLVTPFLKNTRGKQLRQFAKTEKGEEEKMVERNLKLSAGLLGLSMAGRFFVPFRWLALPGFFVLAAPIYRTAWQSLWKDRKLVIEVVDAIIVTSILATGYYGLAAIESFLYFATRKLLLNTENHSTNQLSKILEIPSPYVWLVSGEVLVEIPFDQLQSGDVISLSARQMIPVDGKIMQGDALVVEQIPNGEVQTLSKSEGDLCITGALLLEGMIQVEVTTIGGTMTTAQSKKVIQQSVNMGTETVSQWQNIGEHAVLPTLLVCGASMPLLGVTGGIALLDAGFLQNLRSVSALTALNMVTIAAEEGILLKDVRSMEVLQKVDIVIFEQSIIYQSKKEEGVSIRPEIYEVIQNLHKEGVDCYLFSTGQEQSTRQLAERLDIQHYYSELVPTDKATLIRTSQQDHKVVCMVGGSTQNPVALETADVSISLNSNSSSITDASQILLIGTSLHALLLLFHLSKQFEHYTKVNLQSCILPSLLTVGGVLFLNAGLATAVILSQVGLLLGVGNAIQPLVIYQRAKKYKLKNELL